MNFNMLSNSILRAEASFTHITLERHLEIMRLNMFSQPSQCQKTFATYPTNDSVNVFVDQLVCN